MTVRIQDFFQIHRGEICLIACNGISLKDMPLEFLRKYPSFGCNTIWKHEGFKPWYYAVCDDRNKTVYGEQVMARFADTPKFVPTPNLDHWHGPNFYRWQHRPGHMWPYTEPWKANILITTGIHYACTPQVMMQMAFFMGFTTILIVGMDHRPYAEGYFWGVDEPIMDGRDDAARFAVWEKGHRALYEGFREAGVTMVNITPDSLAQAIPHDDWKNWR